MIVLLALFTFIVNLPMGIWRVQVKKFSWQWFLAIHLTIPLIYFMRTEAGISYGYVPLFIVVAIIGQIAGGRIHIFRNKQRERAN